MIQDEFKRCEMDSLADNSKSEFLQCLREWLRRLVGSDLTEDKTFCVRPCELLAVAHLLASLQPKELVANDPFLLFFHSWIIVHLI